MLRERRSNDPENKSAARLAVGVFAIGFEIFVCITLPTAAAYFLDKKFKTTWILYVGLVIGIGAAIKALVRVVRESQRTFPDEPRPDERRPDEPRPDEPHPDEPPDDPRPPPH
jgi:F0F1-type ATP synthase assembly protein I